MTRETPIEDDRVLIFDTTLRDGEQAPGFSMGVRQKVRMAKALDRLNVDIIEAGFAAASPGDFDAVSAVASEIESARICSLARCTETDIRAAGQALQNARNKRIHVFIATSPIHREYKLKLKSDQVIARALQSIEQALTWCDDVEFSAEDAIRTERAFLAEITEAAIKAGARTINIPDTVGYTTSEEITELFEFLTQQVPGAGDVVFSTHCHDDLGMAVANSLAAVRGGARQIECAINGIGERAGNCALEEAVMALRTRHDFFGVRTGINTEQLQATSRLLSAITGNPVARNKAIVGRNAFAHESGIHQHGYLAHRETYEIMEPETVGVSQDSLVLGKHSGRAALADRAKTLGYTLSDNQLQSVFVSFKELADKKREVFDSDLEALIVGEKIDVGGPWKIEGLHVSTGYGDTGSPYAAVELTHRDGRDTQRTSVEGDGPIDAVFKAIEQITGYDLELEHFEVRSVSAGEDALGEADVRVKYQERSYHGRGADTDVVAAGAQAYLDAVNRIERRISRRELRESA